MHLIAGAPPAAAALPQAVLVHPLPDHFWYLVMQEFIHAQWPTVLGIEEAIKHLWILLVMIKQNPYRNDKVVRTCHNLDTTLLQRLPQCHFTTLSPPSHTWHNLVLYFETVARLYKVMARCSQVCMNLIMRLPQRTLSQPWHNLVFLKLWQSCYKVVTKLLLHCHKALSQPWYKLDTTLHFGTVTRLSHGCYNLFIKLFFSHQVNVLSCPLSTSLFPIHWFFCCKCLQCRHKVAVGWWKYYKVVTSLWQTWHGGYKVAVSLWNSYMVVTRLWQGY